MELPEISTYRDLLRFLVGKRSADDAASRVYDTVAIRDENPSWKHYTCRDGMCIMAVAAGTTDGLPGVDTIMKSVGITLAGIQQETTNYANIYGDISDLVDRFITNNDDGHLADPVDRDSFLDTRIYLDGEVVDYLVKRADRLGLQL